VMPKNEVTMGYWDGTSFSETVPSGQLVNAARVRALRTVGNSNPLNLLLVDIFGPSGAWDVGATAVAEVYVPGGCPDSYEGIKANGKLNFASNTVFEGDICLHGEQAADFNNNSSWRANSDGDKPVITFGRAGALCKGFGNCRVEPPYDNVTAYQNQSEPLTDSMITGTAAAIPHLPQIYQYYADTIANPAAYTAPRVAQNRYIPIPLVTNPNRDPDREAAQLEPLPTPQPVFDANGDPVYVRDADGNIRYGDNGEPIQAISDPLGKINQQMTAMGGNFSTNGGVMRVVMSSRDFKTAIDAANGTGVGPFPPNMIVELDPNGNCSAQGNKLQLTGDAPLEDIVVSTPCRVEFNGTNRFAGSMLFDSYSGNNPAVYGSAGAVIGAGSCDDDTMGSTIVTAGKMHFAAGVHVSSSHIVTLGDVTIAAQGDSMRGTSIMSNSDVSIQSNGGWAGCPGGVNFAGPPSDFFYRLVR
jgi:hypothetical protein